MLAETLRSDLKESLRKGERDRVEALRYLLSKVKNAEIEKRSPLTEEEIQSVIKSLVRKGKEAMEMFERGARRDLVEQEQRAIKILEQYLPEPLSEAEVRVMVREAIEATGAQTLKDMGKVMGVVMEKARNRVEGAKVSELVRRELSK